MPSSIDLTGRVLGRLTVLRPGPVVQFGGPCKSWVCRCECGVELTVPQKRLPYAEWIKKLPGRVVDACNRCRGYLCSECGSLIYLSGQGHGRVKTCSPECAAVRRKRQQREHFHRRSAADPDRNKRIHAARKARAAVDPSYAARLQEYEQKRQQKRKERMQVDPDYAALVRKRARDTYARHADRIQTERRARVDALTPEQREEWMRRAYAYTKKFRTKQLEALKQNPAEYRRYRDIRSEYQRLRHAALAGPPPQRVCVVCGVAFESRKYKTLCAAPECHSEYRRDIGVRYRRRTTLNDFLRIERELNEVLRNDRADENQTD